MDHSGALTGGGVGVLVSVPRPVVSLDSIL